MYLYIALFLFTILLYILSRRSSKFPPGPWGLPIVGYLPWLDPKAPHLSLAQLAERYGPVCGLWMGSVRTVILSDAQLVRKVLMNDAAAGRAPLYVTHGIMKGYGIICSEGDLWKDQRRFVHNCLRNLGGAKIGTQRKTMETLIMKHVHEFIGQLKSTEPIDPHDDLSHCAGSAVNEIVFGLSWPKEDKTWKKLQYLQEEGTKHVGVAGPLNFLPFLRFIPALRKSMEFLLKGQKETHDIYQNIIDEQHAKLRDNEIDVENPTNMLDAFLIEKEKRKNTASEKFYSNVQLRYLLADMFGAGLDTTLSTLGWFLLYIAKHRDIQSRLRNDILEVLNDRDPTLDDMNSFPYFDACLAETQRIRSVVPTGIPHGCVEDIKVEEYTIPKGTMIIPLQWALHMDEKAWPDPDCFDPTRFLNEEGKFVKPVNFMPFQVGKRMCVGDELARMILFLFAISILQKYRLELHDEENVDFAGECGITLLPKPYTLRFIV